MINDKKKIIDFMKDLREVDSDLMSWLTKTKEEFNLSNDQLNEAYGLFQVNR